MALGYRTAAHFGEHDEAPVGKADHRLGSSIRAPLPHFRRSHPVQPLEAGRIAFDRIAALIGTPDSPACSIQRQRFEIGIAFVAPFGDRKPGITPAHRRCPGIIERQQRPGVTAREQRSVGQRDQRGIAAEIASRAL